MNNNNRIGNIYKKLLIRINRINFLTVAIIIVGLFLSAAASPVKAAPGNLVNTLNSPANAAAAAESGALEICANASGAGLENRIFQYKVAGQVIKVATGACSAPIDVPSGPLVVEESAGGDLTGGGTFLGGFRLLDVVAYYPPSPFNPASPYSDSNPLMSEELLRRTATVNIQPSFNGSVTQVLFTNTYAAKAYIVICNNNGEIIPGDTGIFTYTIDSLPNNISVPLGSCTDQILVHIPKTYGAPPASANFRITQLPRQGYTLTSIVAEPRSSSNTFTLDAGGVANVRVVEGLIDTLVDFYNRASNSAPTPTPTPAPTPIPTAFVEICSRPVNLANAPSDNMFRYTVEGISAVFSTPLGSCTPPIQVNVPPTGAVRITQLAKSGFTMASVNTVPPDRFNSLTFDSSGGVADIDVVQGIANLTTVNFNNRILDSTPPVITPVVHGTKGNNGFYTSIVLIDWSVRDSDSTVTSLSGCYSDAVNNDTDGKTFTCSATSAGGTSTKSVTIKRDATKPTLTFDPSSPAANNAGWHNSSVSFDYTVNDNLSGVSASTPSGTLVLSAEGNAVNGSVTVTDNAGNSATFTSPAVNIDKTAPVLQGLSDIRINASSPSPAAYNITAADALTSNPSVVCNPASGFTFPVGVTTVNCTASDPAGNQSSGSFQVAVYTNGQEPVSTGDNVSLQPQTGPAMTFDTVTATGVTTVEPIADPAAIGSVPGGFAISDTVAFQINTTAQFEGSVRLAFVVPSDISLTREEFDSLRVLHGKKNADGTSVLDADGKPVLEDVTEDNPPSSYSRDFNSRTIYAKLPRSVRFIWRAEFPTKFLRYSISALNIKAEASFQSSCVFSTRREALTFRQ